MVRDDASPAGPLLIVNTAEAAIDAAIAGVGMTSVLSYQVERALRALLDFASPRLRARLNKAEAAFIASPKAASSKQPVRKRR